MDGEETTLLVLDTWESEQRVRRGWVLGRAGRARMCPGDIAWAQVLSWASERFEG